MDIDCSIVIPVFNAEKTIVTCLNSLLDTETSSLSFEILVINDGSSDNTSQVVDNYAKSHKLVKLINKPNKGVSSARNEGIRKAVGKYIYFADADDKVAVSVLEDMIKIAEQNDCSMVIADYKTKVLSSAQITRYSSDLLKNTLCDRAYVKNEICRRFFLGNCPSLCPIWNKLFLLKVIKEHGIRFDEARCHGEDWAFCMDFSEHTERLYVLDGVVYQYNLDGSQTYQKYSSNLEYCFIDGHTRCKQFNDKYCKYSKKTPEYRLFMEQFYYRIKQFIELDVSSLRKRKFLQNTEVKECLKYLMLLNRKQLSEVGFSRRDKVVFLLLYIGLFNIVLNYIYKTGRTRCQNNGRQ